MLCSNQANPQNSLGHRINYQPSLCLGVDESEIDTPSRLKEAECQVEHLVNALAESIVLGYLHVPNLAELPQGYAYSRPGTSGCKSPQMPTFWSSHLLKIPLHSVPDLIRQLQTLVHALLPGCTGLWGC